MNSAEPLLQPFQLAMDDMCIMPQHVKPLPTGIAINSEHVDLSAAYVREADLSWTNLSDAEFREATLFKSNFDHAYFIRTALTGARLLEPDLKISHIFHIKVNGSIKKWNFNRNGH